MTIVKKVQQHFDLNVVVKYRKSIVTIIFVTNVTNYLVILYSIEFSGQGPKT